MDRNNHKQTNSNSRIDLARECLVHLDREEAHLGTTRDVLRQAYAAAVGGQRQGMAAVLEHQAQAVAAMRQERESFRMKASAILNVPAQAVTLQSLAAQLPPELGQRLLEKRQHLRARIAEVEGLGRDIALLSHYFLDFLRRFFIELTGGLKCGRYGPEGLRHEPACGSLLQAQG